MSDRRPAPREGSGPPRTRVPVLGAPPAALPLLLALVLAIGAATGCAVHREPLPLRPEPIPYADTLPIPEPEERDMAERVELLRSGVVSQVKVPLPPERPEALNVTRFDDVVSSAWFEHRNGREAMSPEEVARGPTMVAGPDTSRTLTVVAAKTEGVSPGFTVEDPRGDRYLFKFDAKEHPRLGSAAGVIANRLFHAAGYHVPEDYVVVFDSARLVVDSAATLTEAGGEREMEPEDVHEILSGVASRPDGRIRALASRFVPGSPKGPFLFEGVREDDPNDHYQHQHRRELRGLFVMAAWTNHVDMRFANTLDSYVEPGYVRHYLIDFASSLGSSAGLRSHTPRHGEEYQLDLKPVLLRLVTLGLYSKGWEYEDFRVSDRSVGFIPVETYDPASWKPGWPNRAFTDMTDRDGYWGAKLVASFTEEQILAAVAAGQLEEAVSDTLAEILLARQEKTVEYWYSRVSPVEGFEVRERDGTDGGSSAPAGPQGRRSASFVVLFRDLGLERGIWEPAGTVYRWTFLDGDRGIRWWGRSGASGSGLQRLRVRPALGARVEAESFPSPDEPPPGFAVLSVATVRRGDGEERPDVEGSAATVWLRRESPGGGYVVVGLQH